MYLANILFLPDTCVCVCVKNRRRSYGKSSLICSAHKNAAVAKRLKKNDEFEAIKVKRSSVCVYVDVDISVDLMEIIFI